MGDPRATHEFREEKNEEGPAKKGRICIFIVVYRLHGKEVR